MATQTEMGSGVMLEPEQLMLIKDLLRQFLPQGYTVYLFGSRATGRARQYSDVDLALKNGQEKVDSQVLSRLRSAFEASALPYRVDLVDLNEISDSFRQAIEADLRQLI